MPDYATTIRMHRRLAILRHLAEIPDYAGNASILQTVLNGLGIGSTRDQVITEMAWLEDNGFATLTDHGDFIVIVASQSGVEIAKGLATHPGIQRPSPRG